MMLRELAQQSGAAERIVFRPAVPNDELCASLPDYDIFAIRSDYFELSKSMLEALLSGLPVIVNRRPGDPVPELTDEICMLVDNTPDGYGMALQRLISDDAARERLGRSALAHARARWSPAATEAKFVEIYRELLGNRTAVALQGAA